MTGIFIRRGKFGQTGVMQREDGQRKRQCEVRGRNWSHVCSSQGMPRTVNNHQKIREKHGMDSASETLVGTNHDDTLTSDF